MDLCRNIQYAWEKFRPHFHTTLDDIAPYRDIKIRQEAEPWMASDILGNIRNRGVLHKTYNIAQNKTGN